jgi:hypothetical protein
MAAYARGLELMAKHSGFTLPETIQGGLTININHGALGIIEGESKEIPSGDTKASRENQDPA